MQKHKKIIKANSAFDLTDKLRMMDFNLVEGVKVSVSMPHKRRRKLKTLFVTERTYCECCGPERRITDARGYRYDFF